MVKFGGKIGTLYQMLKNAFKKYPPQNRTNVQIKGGGGGQRPFEQCSKKHHFSPAMASLMRYCYFLDTNSHKVGDVYGCFFFRPAQNCEILAEKGQFKS